MKKVISAIIITILFLTVLKIIFDLLYKYDFISGVLRGPYLGFGIIKTYTSVFLLFSIYKVIQYRKEKTIMKEWMPLLFFSFFIFLISIMFLNI